MISIIIPIIGWFIALLTTGLAIYFSRKTRPVEETNLELQAIVTRNNHLETRVKDLEEKELLLQADIGHKQEKITDLTVENKFLHQTITELQATLESTEKALEIMTDQKKTAQWMNEIIRNQKEELIRRFEIPTKMSEVKRDK